jgi:hypothetical protein
MSTASAANFNAAEADNFEDVRSENGHKNREFDDANDVL